MIARFIHTTDTHEDLSELVAVNKFIKKESVSKAAKKIPIKGLFHTGDFIGHSRGVTYAHKPLELKLQDVINTHFQRDEQKEFAEIISKKDVTDPNEIKQLNEKAEKLISTLKEEAIHGVMGAFISSYELFSPILKEIKGSGIPLYGIKGNHDITLADQIMKEIMFLENVPSYTMNIGGDSLRLKGCINSPERPPLERDEFINSVLTATNSRINYGAHEADAKGTSVYEVEKERLNKDDSADIVLMHKNPFDPRDARANTDYATDIAKEGKLFVSGHHHGPTEIRCEYGNVYVRTGTGNFSDIHFDTKKKEVVKVDVYKVKSDISPTTMFDIVSDSKIAFKAAA